jgi:hypothetical protein
MKKGTRVLWHEFVGTVATKPYEMDGYPGVKFVDLDVSHQQTRGADHSVTPTTGSAACNCHSARPGRRGPEGAVRAHRERRAGAAVVTEGEHHGSALAQRLQAQGMDDADVPRGG